MTPFEEFFGKFGRMLDIVGDEKVFSNGHSINNASWDRKAAYLLWMERGRPGEPKEPEKIDSNEEDWDIV